MTIWKRIAFIVAGLGVAAGALFIFKPNVTSLATAPTEVVWQTFSPKDQTFSVQMPIQPNETREKIVVAGKNIDYCEMTAQANGALYAVSYLNFPSYWKMLGTNKLLKKSFSKMIENEKQVEQVISHSTAKHGSFPAYTYVYRKDGHVLAGKFIVVGNTLYRLSVTYPQTGKGLDKVAPDQFLDSFSKN